MNQQDSRFKKMILEILNIFIILSAIVFGAFIAPEWSGWVGAFIISFSIYFAYVAWPIRHMLAKNILNTIRSIY